MAVWTLDKRSIQRKKFTGIRDWLAKKFKCFDDIKSYEPDFSGNKTDYLFLPNELSAIKIWTRGIYEVAALSFAIILLIAAASVYFFGFFSLLTIFSIVGGLFYLSIIVFRLYLTFWSVLVSHKEIKNDGVSTDCGNNFPIYTILVPLYNESKSIPGLVKSLQNLNWPKNKLDVRFIIDRGDDVSLNALIAARPIGFRAVIVKQDPYLRSKPRVLNAALRTAKGEFITIYDAEDRPESDQLRKAYKMFQNFPEAMCLQARLDYYNESQNILTRWFTAEYAAWFGYALPALSFKKLPVPLGGTSNHFRIEFLKYAGAWDSYNVTEDCELGMRIYRLKGKKSIMALDSRTYEEASSDLGNWMRQRSRWIKGFLQTFIVHFRHPFQALNNFRLKGFMVFILLTLGGSLVHWFNIVFWILFLLWIVGATNFLTALFPPLIYELHRFTFIFGNISLILMHVFISTYEKRYKTALISFLIPFYWVLMAVASFKAVYQLFHNPHYWEKTRHHGESV